MVPLHTLLQIFEICKHSITVFTAWRRCTPSEFRKNTRFQNRRFSTGLSQRMIPWHLHSFGGPKFCKNSITVVTAWRRCTPLEFRKNTRFQYWEFSTEFSQWLMPWHTAFFFMSKNWQNFHHCGHGVKKVYSFGFPKKYKLSRLSIFNGIITEEINSTIF